MLDSDNDSARFLLRVRVIHRADLKINGRLQSHFATSVRKLAELMANKRGKMNRSTARAISSVTLAIDFLKSQTP